MVKIDEKVVWKNKIVGHADIDPTQLLANPHNFRIHPKFQQEALRGVINDVGFIRSVTVSKNSGYVLDGHLRVLLALRDNIPLIPVEYVDLTEAEEAEALLTIDPIAAIAGSDKDKIETLLHQVNTDDEYVMKLLTETASDAGLDWNQPETRDAEPQINRADELQRQWGTALGQLWTLGEHRLLIGDCTIRENVERLMGGERADMLLTDPPYNVEYEGNYIQSGEILKKEQKIWSGGIENDNRSDFGEWLLSVYKSINEFMDDGCAIYIWHPSGSDGKYFWASWLWGLWHFQVDLVWNKKSLIISRWDYKPQHEPCMYGWKGKNRKWSGNNNEATVLDLARQQGNSGEERLHPTQKPPVLFEMAIKNHPTIAIFDPFCGSGTTIIAAHNLSRRCYAMEISPAYGAVILQRFSDAFPEIEIKQIN